MKLENQVCSLESSRRLKELGVPQKSLWSWVSGLCGTKDEDKFELKTCFCVDDIWIFSAYTCAELGEILIRGMYYKWETCRDHGNFLIRYGNWEKNPNELFGGKTEAEARAKMLIYLLEQKIIKAEDLG